MSFVELGLSAPLLRAVEALGYTKPTPIQEKAFPVALAGRDLIGIAETGSGKTAGYLLPIFQRLAGKKGLRALILAPTRELALQIESMANDLAAGTGLRALAVIGGVGIRGQLQGLRQGVDVLIATPGRLLDHVLNNALSLSTVEEYVLDEADRLLDMGFLPDIRRITNRLAPKRHSMLFSATFSREIEMLAFEFLKDPVSIELGRRATPVATVEQIAYSVMGNHKTPLLLRLLGERIDGQALVFTRTKRGADTLSHILKVNGHQVETMHADRTQGQRVAALDRFKTGKVKVLVATDIAARGIDVEDIGFVVNYDIPATVDDYVHRIGRTARAGRKGKAITLVSPAEELELRDIERVTGCRIERASLENFSDGRSPEATAMTAALAAAAAFRASLGSPHAATRSFRSRRRR